MDNRKDQDKHKVKGKGMGYENVGLSVRCMRIAITMTERAKMIKELTKSK